MWTLDNLRYYSYYNALYNQFSFPWISPFTKSIIIFYYCAINIILARICRFYMYFYIKDILYYGLYFIQHGTITWASPSIRRTSAIRPPWQALSCYPPASPRMFAVELERYSATNDEKLLHLTPLFIFFLVNPTKVEL